MIQNTRQTRGRPSIAQACITLVAEGPAQSQTILRNSPETPDPLASTSTHTRHAYHANALAQRSTRGTSMQILPARPEHRPATQHAVPMVFATRQPSALVLRLHGEESLLPASCHCCPANSSKTYFSKTKSIDSRRGGRGRGPPTELAQGTRSAACAARGQAISPPGARCLLDRPILALVQAPSSFQIAHFDIRTITSTVGPATFRPAAETKLGGSLAVPQKLWDRSGGRSLAGA